jgi:hypothetical protein
MHPQEHGQLCGSRLPRNELLESTRLTATPRDASPMPGNLEAVPFWHAQDADLPSNLAEMLSEID